MFGVCDMENKIYGIPGTTDWLCTDLLTAELIAEGYIEMSGYPPALSDDERLSGQRYVVGELGEWILEDDPRYKEKLLQCMRKFFGTNVLTPKLIEGFAMSVMSLVSEPMTTSEDDNGNHASHHRLKPHKRK